ncbi:hypothetical protein HGO38_29600 [Rhizobium sp. CG5]|uniref:hypothetical protein n=1 Tax=Rhizobium sp. CG5 TaxID=2726076 RepID=UPI002033FF64|nr:hypothetical protein [Rhizobium sp. CG5]MCM2477607.1 hypothetical protein [Rhizobium sp. CG5]
MALSEQRLIESPAFVTALRFLAVNLQGEFDGNPRLARMLASHQRWLLSQAGFALYLEYDPANPPSGLTAGRLKQMITEVNVASRNTVLNFLDQLLSYRFIRVAGDAHRRPRRFEATEISQQAMWKWLAANLAALDQIDAGDRFATYCATPALFRIVQPRVARLCIDDRRWREPPERVAIFLWTEAGGLVMDELIRRIEPGSEQAQGYDIGRVDARALAGHFMMSRTHLQRLLRKAVEIGCLAWHDDQKKTHLWLKKDYLEEYCRWQAVKFAILDTVFEEARHG